MAIDINFIKQDNSLLFRKISSKRDIMPTDKVDGYLIDADEKEIRKIVEFLKNSKEKKQIAINAQDEMFNRRAIETIKFDYLVSPEFNNGKDSLKQRSSGLNHTLTKIASERKIVILINLNELNKQNKKDKAILIARIIQNIKLCRKSKCLVKIASFSDEGTFSKKERELIGFSWGMSSQQTTKACTF